MTEQQSSLELPSPERLTPVPAEEQASLLEQVVIHGDLARLTPPQRVMYYRQVCDTLGLNPFTKPFQYISLNGRLTLYPTRDATDQLRRNHRIDITGLERSSDPETGVHSVVAHGRDSHGRTDSALGAVNVQGLRGEGLANALMKAETKAKRRLTLSLAGLGMFDETEIETMGNVVPVQVDAEGNVMVVDDTEVRPITEVLAARLEAQRLARTGTGDTPPAPTTDKGTVPSEDIEPPSASGGLVETDTEDSVEDPDAPEPVVPVPGQEALFSEAPEEEPAPPVEAAPARPDTPSWVGTLVGEPADDITTEDDVLPGLDLRSGLAGLKVRVNLAGGGSAVVALHGSVMDEFQAIPADRKVEGAGVKVTGFLRLVPWSKEGATMPPYRRILATGIHPVDITGG